MTSFRLDPSGRAVLTVPATSESYFILYRGDDLRTVQEPAAVAAQPSVADPQSVELAEDFATLLSLARFYRVEKVPIADPKDSDGDSVDDLYELTRRPLLDPLDPADARQDPDGDRRLTLDEYRAGTDPFRYNAPPSPILATSPDSTQGLLLTLRGSATAGTYIRVDGGAAVATNDVAADGVFDVLVRLATNRVNRLFVSSVDAQGVTSIGRPVEVLQDSQPPTLFLDFPTNVSRLTADKTMIAGRVGDSLSGYRGLHVWVHSSPAEGDAPLANTLFPENSPLQAHVDVGIGPNGTYQRGDVPLVIGTNVITVVAADLLGNPTTRRAEIVRLALEGPRIVTVSGDRQTTHVIGRIAEPLVVRAQQADGTPMTGLELSFDVTRSDGRLLPFDTNQLAADWTQLANAGTNGAMKIVLKTDAAGEAKVWWTLGSDAGNANNRVCVMNAGISNAVFFCASAQARPARQINIGSGNNQKVETGGEIVEPLRVWVSDGLNAAPGTQVTFRVVQGSGKLIPGGRDGSPLPEGESPGEGSPQLTVVTGLTGHASVGFIAGPDAGPNLVEASFPGQFGLPATFTIYGVARDPGQPGSFTGLVLDNTSNPVGNAYCRLTVGNFEAGTFSDGQGRFRLENVPGGMGHLFVDGRTANLLFTNAIPTNSFPPLSYPIVAIPNAQNSLATPVLLPRKNLGNEQVYYGTNDLVVTCSGIEGLKMTIKANSMRHADGNPVTPLNPAWVSLNQVHHDNIPMPMPDGASPAFAWTLQPGGATFDPNNPVAIEYPNMSGLPPGSIAYFLSFNHDTERFEIVSSGHITDDGARIHSDPGSGLTLAGWGCNCPPYSVTGGCSHCSRLVNLNAAPADRPFYLCKNECIAFEIASDTQPYWTIIQNHNYVEQQGRASVQSGLKWHSTFAIDGLEATVDRSSLTPDPVTIRVTYSIGNIVQNLDIIVVVFEMYVGIPARVGVAVTPSERGLHNLIVNRDNPRKSLLDEELFLEGPIYSGINNGVGDFIRFRASVLPLIGPGLAKNYEWFADGPINVVGPTGPDASEWLIDAPGVDWPPGNYKVGFRLTRSDNIVCTASRIFRVGWRSPDVHVIGWIDKAAVENVIHEPDVPVRLNPLPDGVCSRGIAEDIYGTQSQMRHPGFRERFLLELMTGFFSYNSPNAACPSGQLLQGNLITPVQPDSARQYINAYMIRLTANETPPSEFSVPSPSGRPMIEESKINAFVLQTFLYRAFSRFQIECIYGDDGSPIYYHASGPSRSQIGITPNAVFGTIDLHDTETGELSGHLLRPGSSVRINNRLISTDINEVGFFVQGRVGPEAQAANARINDRMIPWIWGLIRFNMKDYTYRVDHEIFPTYWIFENGKLAAKDSQRFVEEFIQIGPSASGANSMPDRELVTSLSSKLRLPNPKESRSVDQGLSGLDRDWVIRVNTQVGQGDSFGSFRLSNISSPDQFGPQRSGTLGDFVGDDPVRMIAVSTARATNQYASSEFFSIRQGETTYIRDITFNGVPPRKPDALEILAPSDTLRIGTTNQLRVIAHYTDGTTNDVTGSRYRTGYRLSNPYLATLDFEGGIVPLRPGTVFVTVANEAATAVRGFNQTSLEENLTTVVASVLDSDDKPAVGAKVRVVDSDFDPLECDAEGRVRFERVPSEIGAIRLLVTFDRDGERWFQQVSLQGVAGGVTDFGSVRLRRVDEVVGGSTFGVRETLAAATATSGGVWGWGLVPSGGFSFDFVPEPALATPPGEWRSVSSGRTHLLAIDRNGFGWAWGENQQGQRGWGTPDFNQSFEKADPVAVWKLVSAGNDFSLGIQADGSLWAWGSNAAGQLGLGGESAGLESTNLPTRIGDRFDWVSCSAGDDHCLAIRADGSLWAWGGNSFDQCGVPGSFGWRTPIQVGSDHDWLQISSGIGFSLGLRLDGSLWVWGNNNVGQLGTGTGMNAPEPTPVEVGTQWKAIAAGKNTAVAIKADGTLWWSGRSPETRYAPFAFPPRPPSGSTSSSWVQLGNEGDWQSISAGSYFVMAMREDGTLWACGGLNFLMAAWLELGRSDGPHFGINQIFRVESESPWLAPVP